MIRNGSLFALPLVGLLVLGCENGSDQKAPAPSTSGAAAPLVANGPLPVVSAALPKPIDMGPLPVPADPAVLAPAGTTKAAAGDPPKTNPTEPPSIRANENNKTTPGPMAPRTPATM